MFPLYPVIYRVVIFDNESVEQVDRFDNLNDAFDCAKELAKTANIRIMQGSQVVWDSQKSS